MSKIIQTTSLLLAIIAICSFISCNKESKQPSISGNPTINFEKILDNYEIIWGMDFLPSGDLLFCEKRGKLYIKKLSGVEEVFGLPSIDASGQGGLLDIKVHPNYANNGWVYISYTSSTPYSSLKLSRFKIVNNKILNLQHIFSSSGPLGHNGSRILFDKKGFLFLSIGEGPSTGGGTSGVNKNSLDPTSPWGKVHRLNDDGTIPTSNPTIPGNASYNSIFAYGLRNSQGLALHHETGEIWLSEHGPLGGDEINILTPAGNFGWPAYSLGINYDGSKISDGHVAPGVIEPIYSWIPSIGTCGIIFINGNKFKSWVGSLLVSGLASQKLHRCIIKNGKIVGEEIVIKDLGRIRNVIQGPDESIYFSVEGPGRIYKMLAE